MRLKTPSTCLIAWAFILTCIIWGNEMKAARANNCCQFSGPPVSCRTLDDEDCLAAGGTPYGNLRCNNAGTMCEGKAAPTVSQWGLIILTLAVAIGGSIIVARRHSRVRPVGN